MSRPTIQPTGIENAYGEDDLIVTKTDLKGHITYANDLFVKLSGYTRHEIEGAPHNMIRHPEMPRCVFKLLWESIAARKEIFAYVVNLAKNGNHYWVFAHVTPSLDWQGNVVGYHSNRRKPDAAQIAAIKPLYAQLSAEEQRHGSAKDGLAASSALLTALLKDKGLSYDEFIFAV